MSLNLNWILLEPKDLSDYLIPEQLSLVAPQDTILKNIIADTSAYIQQRIPDSLKPHPFKPNQIPDACKQPACHLIIEALQTRSPELTLSEDQTRAAEQARKALEALFAEWNPKPDGKQQQGAEPRIEAVHYRKREARQSTLKGL